MQPVQDELAFISESLTHLSIRVTSLQHRILPVIQVPRDNVPEPAESTSLDHERENKQDRNKARQLVRDHGPRRTPGNSTSSAMAEGTPPVAESSLRRDLTPPAEELEGQPVYEVSVHPASEISESGRYWIHHSRKIPQSARGFRKGPFNWADLQRCLQLNDETMETLDCLCLAPDQSLRVHLHQNFAFLHDPVYLEEHIDGVSATYLIDWGSPESNSRISDEITQQPRDVIHTFVYPRQRARWAYIGAHSWEITGFWDVWQALSKRSRVAIVTHLAGRSVDPPERIAERINCGELTQICVRIEIQSIEESDAFYQGLNHKRNRNRGKEAA